MEFLEAELAWAKNMGLEKSPEYRRLSELCERLKNASHSSD